MHNRDTHQHYVLTLDNNVGTVFRWIEANNIQYELHLNRTRFWVPSGAIYTEFLLRFAHCCPPVDPRVDLISGR